MIILLYGGNSHYRLLAGKQSITRKSDLKEREISLDFNFYIAKIDFAFSFLTKNIDFEKIS